jgi:hypothetical protein
VNLHTIDRHVRSNGSAPARTTARPKSKTAIVVHHIWCGFSVTLLASLAASLIGTVGIWRSGAYDIVSDLVEVNLTLGWLSAFWLAAGIDFMRPVRRRWVVLIAIPTGIALLTLQLLT